MRVARLLLFRLRLGLAFRIGSSHQANEQAGNEKMAKTPAEIAENPQPGDQLRDGRRVITVTEAGEHVLYEVRDPSARGFSAIPLACRIPMRGWRQRVKGWEAAK